MAYLVSAAILVFVSCATLARGLTCNEGFNMTFNGIPLYLWNERKCSQNSKCIEQDLTFSSSVAGKAFNADLRYGSCMNSAYASYLDCDNLFGKDSKFDPANLLNMIPAIEGSVTNAIQVFAQNTSASLKELLSNGNGVQTFVDGVFIFYGDLGFNLTMAAPLKPALAKCLAAAIDGKSNEIAIAVYQLLQTIIQLDTGHPEFSTSIRTFLKNIGVEGADLLNLPVTAMVDRLPGLVRSMFPSDWQLDLWYDVAFKLIGNVNPSNWTKSAEDMAATIKSTYQIPQEVAVYVNPILDAIPDLAKGSQTNSLYIGKWSLSILKTFSEVDSASRKFSSSLESFIQAITQSTLQEEFRSTIYWIPGLFYRMFPGDKAVIQKVYRTMADGFSSFDFKNLSNTAPSAPETKLSGMIRNLTTTLGGGPVYQSLPIINALVVNFSKMFYDLMNITTVDYTIYIDNFATVIDDEFQKWPLVNVGKMISRLITTMGGQVPSELNPLLVNMQPILTAAMEQPMNAAKLIKAMYGVTDSYKTSYPKSPFPELAERYIRIMYQMLTLDYSNNFYLAVATSQRLNMELQYWQIDLQFALVRSFNIEENRLHQMITNAWPDYDLYIRILRAIDSEDVKQLLKNILQWMYTPPPRSAQGFVDATKPTFQKFTKSIETYLGQLRQSFAPDSCTFSACETDLCNVASYVSVKTEPEATTVTTSTTETSDVTTVTDEILTDTTANVEFTEYTTLEPDSTTVAIIVDDLTSTAAPIIDDEYTAMAINATSIKVDDTTALEIIATTVNENYSDGWTTTEAVSQTESIESNDTISEVLVMVTGKPKDPISSIFNWTGVPNVVHEYKRKQIAGGENSTNEKHQNSTLPIDIAKNTDSPVTTTTPLPKGLGLSKVNRNVSATSATPEFHEATTPESSAVLLNKLTTAAWSATTSGGQILHFHSMLNMLAACVTVYFLSR